jgi:hypothetical protein
VIPKGHINEKITIVKNNKPVRNRILIATPTLGIIRAEWAQSRYGQIIPTNWMAASASIGYAQVMPLGFLVADAQNVAVQTAVKDNYEWLLFVEDDVVIPIDTFARLNEYMKTANVPVVSGLYFLKAEPTEPLVYRGRGNGCFSKFKLNSVVWADGVPTGCLLIHGSLLKLMYAESPEYATPSGMMVRKVFETPQKTWFDPERMTISQAAGTSDLYWCDRVMRENVLARSGWKKIAKRAYPFLVDTSIKCFHIDLTTGRMYPPGGYKE